MVVLRKRGVERGRKRTMAGGVIVVLVFHGAEGRNDELAQTARDAGTRAAFPSEICKHHIFKGDCKLSLEGQRPLHLNIPILVGQILIHDEEWDIRQLQSTPWNDPSPVAGPH